MLTTEQPLEHFHGVITHKVQGLNRLRSEELVEINPQDATTLGIAGGEMVKVISRRGEVTAKAKVTSASSPGVVGMSRHFAESPTNVLTIPALDPVAKTPETKVCAVWIEEVERKKSHQPTT